MTTENQPARMGDDLADWALARAFREQRKRIDDDHNGPFTEYVNKGWNSAIWTIQNRARELSAHGGDGGGDDLRYRVAHAICVADGANPEQVVWQGNPPEPYSDVLSYYLGHADAALAVVATQQPASGEAGCRSMDSAPKDGTIVRLLVRFTDNGFEDVGPEELTWTIGQNAADHHPEDDEWLFAGWNWEQDCFTQGVGTPVGWLPMLTTPAIAAHGGSGEGWLAKKFADHRDIDDAVTAGGISDPCETCGGTWFTNNTCDRCGTANAIEQPTPPTSASDAEVEDELDHAWSNVWQFSNDMHDELNDALIKLRNVTDALTRSPARVGGESMEKGK